MDLALHSPSAYPLIKQGFMRAKSTNHRPARDKLSPRFVLQYSCFELSLSRVMLQENPLSSMGRANKVSVCCKKPSDRGTSNPSKSNQEEIISLLKRIQSSISKGESRGVEEKNLDESSESKPLTKAVLDVLEKSRKKSTEEVPRPPSGFVKRTPSASGPRGKLPVSISDKALGEMTKEEEKASLIETMKLAELKEVAKKRGIKGYSKLRKSELLELIRSSYL
ncbi:PREDICTED: uncharacterized protein LOC104731704 isoform X2 [Camelina sativa]|uniref:Uncharacterized protein LOC104731704 isoform X2 n=1 Tax=Camelina sativa TaxID=90675 RepID=A0ABM0V1M6_CAMSA|nr:PREDICTED: uncharacterized protein LOC104731704 isoform X2 [Camelina sativa]